MQRESNIYYLHRGVSPRTGAELSRLTRDPNAAWLRDNMPLAERQPDNLRRFNERNLGDFDKVLARQRNAQQRDLRWCIALIAIVPMLCLIAIGVMA